MRTKLFGPQHITNCLTRYACYENIGLHIGRFKNKFTLVQASDTYVNIYHEKYSKSRPYQSIDIGFKLKCSNEF